MWIFDAICNDVAFAVDLACMGAAIAVGWLSIELVGAIRRRDER